MIDAYQSTQTESLVRAIEIWKPDARGERLEWASGVYGCLNDLREASQKMHFAKGEGLPGSAWEQRRPLVVNDLFVGDFRRSDEAARAGLTAGVAAPVIKNGEVQAIVVFLCGDREGAQGAFEVWRRTDRDELGLDGGYYAHLERFGAVSRFVKFPRGSGLPGEVWNERFPKIIARLGESPNFMRAAGARAEALDVGVGLPIMRSTHDLAEVLVMLSSNATPIARAFELWVLDEQSEVARLRLHSGSYGDMTQLADQSRELSFALDEGFVGRVWRTEEPQLATDIASQESARAASLREYDFHTALGMPIFIGSDARGVFVMLS